MSSSLSQLHARMSWPASESAWMCHMCPTVLTGQLSSVHRKLAVTFTPDAVLAKVTVPKISALSITAISTTSSSALCSSATAARRSRSSLSA